MENYKSASNLCLENLNRFNYENDGIPEPRPICESNPNGLYPMIWTLTDRVEFISNPVSIDSVIINKLNVDKIIEKQEREILEKANFPKELIDNYIKKFGIEIGFAMLGILYWYKTGYVNELLDIIIPGAIFGTIGNVVHNLKDLLINPREFFNQAKKKVPSFRQKLYALDVSTLTPSQRRNVDELKASLTTLNQREMPYVRQPMTFEFIYKNPDPLIKNLFKRVHQRTRIPFAFNVTDELKKEIEYSIENKFLCEGKLGIDYMLSSLEKNKGVLISRSMIDGYNAIVGIVLFELFPDDVSDFIYIDVFCSGTCTKNIGTILMLLMKHIVWIAQFFEELTKPNYTHTIRLNSVRSAVGFYSKQGFKCETLAVQGKKRKTKKRSRTSSKKLSHRHSRKH